MATDHRESITNMGSQLEMISELLRQPPGEDHKQLVKDVLKECQDQRGHMEHIALEVIDKEGGDILFNKITQQLEQLDEMQKSFEKWASGAGHPQSSPPMSSASPAAMSGFGGGGDMGGFGSDDFGQGPPPPATSEGGRDERPRRGNTGETVVTDGAASDTRGRRKKGGKKKKEGDAAEDWPVEDSFGGAKQGAAGGFGDFQGAGAGAAPRSGSGWPGSGDAEGDTAWGHNGGGGGGGGDWGGDQAGGWGQAGSAPSFSANTFGDAAPSSGGFGDGGGWGAPASAPAGGGGFPSFPEESGGSFGSKSREVAGGWAADPPPLQPPAHAPGSPGGESQLATLEIQRPYNDIADDVDGFKMRFIQSVSQATGVAPHRIRVNSVRPGY